MGGRVKRKGETPESLYGETGEPIPGTIIKVMSKSPGFDHKYILQTSYRVLYKDGNDLLMAWFNTYQETKSDGERTQEFVGDKNNLDRNKRPMENEAAFDACCASTNYKTLVSPQNYPPQCLKD